MSPMASRIVCVMLALLVCLPAPAALAAAPARPDAPSPVTPSGSGQGQGQGQGEESRTVVIDPTVDRFTSLLPWPTNRSLYGMEWRHGGAYGLIVGSGGTLLKWTGTAVEQVETGTEEGLFDLDWKADGSSAIIVGNRSTILVWDAATDDLTLLPFSGSVQMFGVAWDPSGAGALIVGDGGYVAYYNGSGLVRIDSGTTVFLYRVAWRPGADYAVAVGDEGVVLELNTTMVRRKVDLPITWNLWRVGWAADGSYALLAGQQYISFTPEALVTRYNASGTYEAVAVPGAPRAGLRGLQFAIGTSQAIIVGENSTAFLWDGTALTGIAALDDRTLRGVGWEGDGTHALAVGNRGVLMRWDGASWGFRSYDPQAGLTSIAWRPQGDYGLVVGFGGYAAKVSVGGSSAVDTGVTSDLYDVDWSSDGAFALVCGAEGRVLRYDAGTGAVTSIKTWLPGGLGLHGVAVKPGEETALAVGDAGQVWLWTGGMWFDKKLLSVSQNMWDVAWRPDGAFAVIVGVSGMALNFTGGQTTVFDPPTNGYNNLYSVCWNKDGTAAMVVGTPIYSPKDRKWYDGIEMYDGVGWNLVEGHTNTTYWGCAFTADGETGLAFGQPDYIVKYSPREGNAVRTSFRNGVIYLQRAAMDPTGKVVYFCGAGGYAYRMDVGRFQNRPPKLVISSPGTGSSFLVGAEVVLDTAGTYDPDGDAMSVTWWSNVSGFLGAGRTLSIHIDSPGWHRITCYADDGHGHNVSKYVLVRFDVPNYPPVPVIESPLEGAIYTTDDTIVFDANGSTDANGDALTFHWVSQLSGDIGFAQRVETALPAGLHHVILWADDGMGGRTAAFVNITVAVANRPPRVYVTAPIEGQRFLPTDTIECNASYSVDPDGDALEFTWYDNAAVLGTGVVLRVVIPQEGAHLIAVHASDGRDHTVIVGVNVTVARPQNLPPMLSVSAPANNSQVQGVVNVTGTASDPEGSLAWVRVAVGAPSDWVDATGLASWRHQWDTRRLADGLYQIWVEASDGVLTTRAWVQYIVRNPPPPNEPPTVTLATVVPASLKGALTLDGSASDPDGSVAKVQVRIDAEPWVDAVGTVLWNYYLDTKQYEDGPHALSIRSWDGTKYSELVTRQFIIDNTGPEDGGGGGVTWLLIVGILAVIVVVAAVAVLALRGKDR